MVIEREAVRPSGVVAVTVNVYCPAYVTSAENGFRFHTYIPVQVYEALSLADAVQVYRQPTYTRLGPEIDTDSGGGTYTVVVVAGCAGAGAVVVVVVVVVVFVPGCTGFVVVVVEVDPCEGGVPRPGTVVVVESGSGVGSSAGAMGSSTVTSMEAVDWTP
jgi:hypothetical protein